MPADPAITLPIAFSVGDGWQDMTGNYVSFRVPSGWQPVEEEPGEGSVLDQWRLGIPGVEYDQVLAFFAVPFDELQPPDLISTDTINIGGQPGAKWVRGGEGTISYGYYTSGVGGAGSFGIHVTVPEADPELETLLDMVAASVTFPTGDEAAVEKAVLDALGAQGAPTENARVDVQKDEDALSPGADLPPGPRLAVQRPDNSIQYVSLD
ncbi:MAG: hypothetical protein GTN77_12820, partial [Planctomycetales bacterium]|nr:hypothetical protein [Planctomycetales bacterium]